MARSVADSRRRSSTDSDSVLATPIRAITTATPSSPTTTAEQRVDRRARSVARCAPALLTSAGVSGRAAPHVLEHQRRVGAGLEAHPERRDRGACGASASSVAGVTSAVIPPRSLATGRSATVVPPAAGTESSPSLA